MHASEAAILLGFCASYDQRRVGEADARAWKKALDDNVTLDDAQEAVAEFYGEVAERRVMPADVNRWSRTRRAARIAAYTGTPEPPAELDDTPRESQRWVREFWKGIGDGLDPTEADARACAETDTNRYGIERARPVDKLIEQTAKAMPRIPNREQETA